MRVLGREKSFVCTTAESALDVCLDVGASVLKTDMSHQETQQRCLNLIRQSPSLSELTIECVVEHLPFVGEIQESITTRKDPVLPPLSCVRHEIQELEPKEDEAMQGFHHDFEGSLYGVSVIISYIHGSHFQLEGMRGHITHKPGYPLLIAQRIGDRPLKRHRGYPVRLREEKVIKNERRALTIDSDIAL